MRMMTRVAGVVASTACAVGLMGTVAFAAPSHLGYHHYGQWGDDAGDVSILSGNSVDFPIAIPVNICGNAIAILGFAEAGCQGGANAWLNNE